MDLENKLISKIRKWWRPLTCFSIFLTMTINGAIAPSVQLIQTGTTTIDLSGLSLLVGAVAAAFAVREWGKAKGNE